MKKLPDIDIVNIIFPPSNMSASPRKPTQIYFVKLTFQQLWRYLPRCILSLLEINERPDILGKECHV
jgi:hypothetical protein